MIMLFLSVRFYLFVSQRVFKGWIQYVDTAKEQKQQQQQQQQQTQQRQQQPHHEIDETPPVNPWDLMMHTYLCRGLDLLADLKNSPDLFQKIPNEEFQLCCQAQVIYSNYLEQKISDKSVSVNDDRKTIDMMLRAGDLNGLMECILLGELVAVFLSFVVVVVVVIVVVGGGGCYCWCCGVSGSGSGGC